MIEISVYQQRLVIVVYIAKIIVINVKFVKRVSWIDWYSMILIVIFCLFKGFKINVNNDKCVVNYIIAWHHAGLVIKLCTVVP